VKQPPGRIAVVVRYGNQVNLALGPRALTKPAVKMSKLERIVRVVKTANILNYSVSIHGIEK
jgi:hypothetical protein